MRSPRVFVAGQTSRTPWCKLLLLGIILVHGGLETQKAAARPTVRPPVFNTQESAVPRIIKPAEPITQQIKGGETQSFTISLVAGQYAEFVIQQHGSILLATLFDPQGAEIIQMDTPSGGHGPIYFSAIASLSGDHLLKVLSVNRWSNPANYDLSLTVLRNAEDADKSLVNAQFAFARGRKNFRANNASDAVESYLSALAYWKTTQNYHWQALTNYALSEASRDLGERRKYLGETLRILAVEMAPHDWRLKASALNDLGTMHSAAGENEKALSTLNEALSLYTANNDQRGQASVLGNLGRFHGRAGNLSIARELIDKAMLLRKAENDKPGQINLLNSLGGVSDQLGEPDQALNYFAQALHEWEALDEVRPADHGRIAAVLNNLATVSDKLGKWDQALEYYDKALAKFAKDDPNRAATLDSKGELYATLGDFANAKACYDEALRLVTSTEKPNLDVKAGLFVHLGQLSLAEGDLASALRSFEQARSLKPNPLKRADVLTNLGGALMLSGKLEEAREAYKEALEIQLELRDKRGQALTLQKRGDAHLLLGQQSEALDDYNRALVYWKAVRDRRGEAATFNAIARLERARGNLAVALFSNNEAIKSIESLRTNVSSRQLRMSYFAIQGSLYEFDIDLNMQLSKANGRTEHIASAIESNERARARVLLEALSEANVGRATSDESSDSQLARLVSQRTTLSRQFEAKAQARTKLLSGTYSDPQIDSFEKDLQEINRKIDELEAQIRSRNPRFATLIKPEPLSLQKIQQQLDGDTLLLEYSLGEKRSYVWAVTPDSIHGFELQPREKIEEVAHRFRAALTARNQQIENETGETRNDRVRRADAESVAAAKELTKLVLEPVAHLLGQKRLVIVADGALQLVPFATLPAPANALAPDATARSRTPKNRVLTDQSQWLVDDHEIVSLPSASVLAVQRRELANRKPAPHAIAVLADPVFDEIHRQRELRTRSAQRAVPRQKQQAAVTSQESPTVNTASDLSRALRDVGIERISWLPFSRTEAEAILSVAPKGQAMAALGFDASRATATSARLSNYRIIHIATHGIVNFEHPELSGIVLSLIDENGQPQEGFLRLHDIYSLNLPADLVVLSACETGVGKQIKGEGLIALTRGFMYAGAPSVVASLWKVNDRATAELMAEFYKQMFIHRRKPAAALSEAQRKLSQNRRWRSPYYWAGFVLQGEWK